MPAAIGADTDMLLAALARREALLRGQQTGTQPARDALRGLLAAIRAARPEIEASALPARAVKLAQLIGLIERKIEALAQPALAPLPEPAGEARLAVAPSPEQPALSIPSPSAGERTLTLAHDRGPPPAPASDTVAVLPEVSWLDAVPRRRARRRRPRLAETAGAGPTKRPRRHPPTRWRR
jgi:hypothetical protein